jgi:hypothetical protein
MKTLTRSNRIYDTTRFGQPEIRVRHRPGTGKKCPHYVLRCGCCTESSRVYYADDGLEIGGVYGAMEDWREILLPLLLIGRRSGRFVDLRRKEKRKSGGQSGADHDWSAPQFQSVAPNQPCLTLSLAL